MSIRRIGSWLSLVLLATPAVASTLRIGIPSPMTSFDCQEIRDVASIKPAASVFDTLVATAPRSTRLVPGLATSWSQSNRFATWTFVIRKNVVFSEGTPATPVIIADSLRSVAELSSRGEIVGDDGAGTVTFKLTAPDSEFPAQLAQIFTGVSVVKQGKLVGTGPYLYAADATLEAPKLFRNHRYWGPAPKVDEIVFRVFNSADGSSEKLRKAIENDEIDLTDMLPPWEAERAAQLPHVSSRSVPSRGLTMLAFNLKKTPLDDARLRIAIAHAINRNAIVDQLFPGEKPARAPVPPLIQPMGKDPWDTDPARAARLVAEVSLPKNWEPTIVDAFVLGSGKTRIGDLIAKDLAAIGIKAKVVIVPTSAEFLDRLAKGKFDMAVSRWIADTGSVADFLSSNLMSTAKGTCPSCNNIYGYEEPEVDRLIGEFRATRNPAALSRINEIFGRDAPYVPLAIGPEVAVWNDRVSGYGPAPTPILDLRDIALASSRAVGGQR